jgi:pimeloyl-ACP methyl ester carboxylesterase
MNKTILHRSATVHYRLEGPGWHKEDLPVSPCPVLLLHGFAEDSTIWKAQEEYLEEDFPLIVPDLPGSGRSSFPDGETTMDELAATLKAIVDEEKIERFVMIGHSLGGYITLAFAERYPDRLKALGLFHSTAYADSEEKKIARKKSIEFIRKNGSAAFIRQAVPNLFAENFRKNNMEIISELISRFSGFSPDTLVQYYEAMIRRPDRISVLRNFTGPVLFITGEEDAAVPLAQTLQQCHIPALTHLHVLENTGHMGMLEDSLQSNRVLFDFLKFIFHA